MRDMSRALLPAAALTGAVASSIIFVIASVGASSPFAFVAHVEGRFQAAAVFFVHSITVEKLRSDYAALNLPAASSTSPMRILIVPGHEPDLGGTAFGGMYERDVAVAIADNLAALLARNPHYAVMVARTKDAWHPILQSYFDTHANDIEAFRQAQTLSMQSHIAAGDILPQADQMYHNTAPSITIEHLYGINKWTSENHYDLTIHLHVNDYAGRPYNKAGTYSGFAIYVPNHQFSNGPASIAVGKAIAARLNANHATSTLPAEAAGVIEDQDLIAIGSNNSADDAALLIEYGYIYEPQFVTASVRPVALEDYAYETYLGLQDFFHDPIPSLGTDAFPYDWSKVSGYRGETGPGIYALQAALHREYFYPPMGRSLSDCSLSGKFGPCTRDSVVAYQKAHHITPTGILGPATRAALAVDFPL